MTQLGLESRSLISDSDTRIQGSTSRNNTRFTLFMIAFLLISILGINAMSLNWGRIISNCLGSTPATLSDTVPGNAPVALCSTDINHLFKFTDVEIDPIQPQPGQNFTISAQGYLEKEVTTGSYLDVVVNWGFITLVNKRYDLCEILPKADIECPAAPGEYSVERTLQIPDAAPPGTYSIEAKAYNAEEELLSCLTAELELSPIQ